MTKPKNHNRSGTERGYVGAIDLKPPSGLASRRLPSRSKNLCGWDSRVYTKIRVHSSRRRGIRG